jgi:hypothetical protein
VRKGSATEETVRFSVTQRVSFKFSEIPTPGHTRGVLLLGSSDIKLGDSDSDSADCRGQRGDRDRQGRGIRKGPGGREGERRERDGSLAHGPPGGGMAGSRLGDVGPGPAAAAGRQRPAVTGFKFCPAAGTGSLSAVDRIDSDRLGPGKLYCTRRLWVKAVRGQTRLRVPRTECQCMPVTQ